MKRKLEMDNIRKGMYITILRGKIEERMRPGPNGPMMFKKEKDLYKGQVLEVLALDLPYIVVAVHTSRGVRNDTLDLRNIEVMLLTEEYIHNLLPKLELKRDDFWDEIQLDIMIDEDKKIEEIFKGL